ncbi:LacI family DNA-binding transcriptional regulator [Staphylococcus carnosus]|uniref:LacI family DNA-binding transcriptional regulator n=1 Tax=Staphylococcus carnosus TaxID=1281 RepID=UPI00081A3CC8|nr:LacI family DNA-binding transcriptional regulator [Staphylococcus carnosus]ANZ32534.1 catabolite control protein A [Staphylococcus carnosus]UTB79892.1 catabolite control protein A [Staphylococcus carnosus]UTB84660.1 catabolite control protein A [Staphylococcus carnosus]
MKKSQPTLHDIARISGLSIATVNKVLEDKRHVASDSTRDKVVEALEMLGYEPSRYIQSLRGEQTKTIAFIIPRHDAYYASIIDAIEHQKGSESIRIIAMASNEKTERQDELIDWFVSQQVDGIIVSPVSAQMRIVQRWRDIPMLIIDNHIEDESLPYVGLNHEDSAYKAAEHLLKQQHEIIGLLLGNPESSTAADSRMGYKAALEDFNLNMDERLITYQYSDLSMNATEKYGTEAVEQLLSSIRKPSAIIVANHALLIGVLHGLNNNGVKVPEDIAVVTLEENNWNTANQPQLTAVGIASKDIGASIFKQLQRFFNGEDKEIQSNWLPSHLIIRDSSQ